MSTLALWRYEMRRAGWAALVSTPIAVAAGAAAAVTYPGDDATTARVLLATLEMAVPLTAGVVSASLVGRDPAVELQLTVPIPYRVTLLRRLLVTLASASTVAAVTAAVLVASGWWARWPANHGTLVGQLTWISPTLGLGALGFAAAVVLRSPGAAGGLVAMVWALHQFAADLARRPGPGRFLYLFATTRGTTDGWTANRVTLLAVAALLVAVAVVVLGRSERLLRGEDD